MGSIRGKAHFLPDAAHSIGQHFSGAMEEMSQTVQNAITHSLKRQSHEHARNIATVSISAGRWNVTCMGSIRRKTHGALPRHTTNSEHTSGAMEEMSEKVQNASTHALRRRIHEHAHSSRSVQRSVQGGDGRYMRGFDLAPELTPYCHNTPQNSEHTSGAME